MPAIQGVQIAIGRSQYQTGFDIVVDDSNAASPGDMSEPGAEGGNHAFPARSSMGSYAAAAAQSREAAPLPRPHTASPSQARVG
jgi:hypothetical protein